MAGYATTTDLVQYVPEAALTGISSGDRQVALDDASAEADTYLRAQYTLPLGAPYDRTLVRHVCALAAWALLCRRGFNPEQGSNKTFETNYDKAIAWLKALARREVSLAESADASPTIAKGGPRVSSKPRQGWNE
jgi:phage gp36-like protein